jgi:hypothetical protein
MVGCAALMLSPPETVPSIIQRCDAWLNRLACRSLDVGRGTKDHGNALLDATAHCRGAATGGLIKRSFRNFSSTNAGTKIAGWSAH